MAATTVRAFSPSADAAIPKNTEKTTICRISFVAIDSTTERGTRCVTNSLSVSELTLRLVDAPMSGSGNPMLSPGCSKFTMKRPSTSDASDAEMNHPIVFNPMRPIDVVSPMWATPTTSVENTRGAMIILIRRRKMSVMSEM